jgi:nucleoside-diphosphate-sugar epimerase
LLEILQEATGTAIEARQVELQAGELQASALDSSLIERDLGWRPTVVIEAGLQQTFEWYRRSSST